MMGATPLRQGTAVTVRLGPFIQTDGITAFTSSRVATDIQTSRNHGAFANKSDTTAPVHDQDGWYSCVLNNTTDTDVEGPLIVKSDDSANHLPVWREFVVVPQNVYDAMVDDGTDKLQVDQVQYLSSASPALVSGNYPANVETYNTDAITAAALSAAAVDKIVDQVWDELVSAHTTAGSAAHILGATGPTPATASGTPTTSVIDSDVGETTVDHFVGERLTFTSGDAKGESRPIIAYDGAGEFTVGDVFSGLPLSTDTFVVQPASANVGTWRQNQVGNLQGSDVNCRVAQMSSTIITAIGDEVIEAVTGTADSGSTTTLVDDALNQADDDYWKGNLLLMTSGNIAGQVRRITAFSQASDQLTVDTAFTQAVSGQDYKILRIAYAEAPAAGSFWSGTEQENIRQALGVDGTKTDGGVAGDLQDLDAKVPDTISLANIKTQATTALSDIDLDVLISAATTTEVVDNSIIAKMVANDSPATWASYSSLTMSLEAIANAINNVPLAADNADAVWNEVRSEHVGGTTFGGAIPDILSLANIKTQVTTALSDIQLDHLLHMADASTTTTNSILAKLASDDGIFANFDNTTDSLEALRLRGDISWITSVATSTLTTVDLDTALSDIQLDHLLHTADASTTTVNSILAKIAGTTGDFGTFVSGDDSLQAQRDNFDAQVPDVVSLANINTQVDNAIVTYGLDHLVFTSVLGADIANDSIIAQMTSSAATADWDTYANTDDSLQAISEGGGSGDWSATEKENIRQALGVDGTKTAGGTAGDLQEATISLRGNSDTGSTSTTIIDATNLTQTVTDYWVGSVVTMTSGPSIGQSRRIVAFNTATDTITVDVAFKTAIGNNESFIITPQYAEAPAAGSFWNGTEQANIRQALEVDGTKTDGGVTGDLQDLDAKVPDTISLANIKTQVDTALSDIFLDHLIAVATTTEVVDNSIIAKMVASDVPATWASYSSLTMSLEAIATALSNVPQASDNADAVWDEVRSEHVGGTTFGGAIPDIISLANIKTQVDTALSDIQLDHLLDVADASTTTTNSIIAKLASDDGIFAGFDNTTDSLEAIRNNTAWDTAVGFSTHTAADVWTVGTRELTTLTAGQLAAIKTEVTTALSDIFLDNLFANAEADEAVNNSYWAKMVSSTGDASTFTPTTDSLQALRANQITSGIVSGVVEANLEAIHLDHLFDQPILDVDVADNSFAAKLTDSTAVTADYTNYDNTTDSLRAQRDNLDIQVPDVVSLANIKTQIDNSLGVDTIPELGVGQPAATPTVKTAMMLLYMALRNEITEDGSDLKVRNAAGSVIAKKATSDAGGTYTEAQMVSGP